MNTSKSDELFATASTYIPGGVNSPVRAFGAVPGNPVFIEDAQGCRLRDVDGNEYIDYVCSWGPLILGHSHPAVVEAIREAALKGTSYGAPCEAEVDLARTICEAIPSMEMVRMVNSGTEATMSAIRLARAYTGRQLILKFEGCYHGHADSFLIKAGSGMMTTGVPTSPGVPGVLAEQTLVGVYNDISSVEQQFRQHGPNIAAVIIEPVAANMGLVTPDPQFLKELRRITELYGSLLIFDEVITGFRTCFGGFQNLIDIRPDLTTLGKIIGGGLPVGAYGGRRDIMKMVSPSGDVYQAGTLSGNPLAMAAGLATLGVLKDSDWYDRLEVVNYYLTNKIKSVFEDHDLLFEINHLASMFTVFFTENPVTSFTDVQTSDTEFYGRFHRALLNRGVYLPPSQFEVCFVSCAHELQDVDLTVEAVSEALDELTQR
jgi:glutamate-1-semialdehyde 2,1-aminomutase